MLHDLGLQSPTYQDHHRPSSDEPQMQVKTSGQRLRETHVNIESYGPSDSYSPQINIRPAGRTIAAAQGLLIRPQCNCWSEGTGGLKFLRDQLEELNGYPIFGNKIGFCLNQALAEGDLRAVEKELSTTETLWISDLSETKAAAYNAFDLGNEISIHTFTAHQSPSSLMFIITSKLSRAVASS